MYSKVINLAGSGGILPRENLNFQNLRNAIFGLLALLFALLQTLLLLNLKAIFLVTPLTHHNFSAGPPFEAIFFCIAPSNPTSLPYLIKNERSLSTAIYIITLTVYLFSFKIKNLLL